MFKTLLNVFDQIWFQLSTYIYKYIHTVFDEESEFQVKSKQLLNPEAKKRKDEITQKISFDLLCSFSCFWAQMLDSRPENLIPGRIFCVESEFEVRFSGLQHLEAKNQEKLPIEVFYHQSYARNLILVNLILVNFFSFLAINRDHASYEGRHQVEILPTDLPDLSKPKFQRSNRRKT